MHVCDPFQLEKKIKLLEETRSDLEAEVEKLEKQMKQLEILPSDIEQLAKVHIHVLCSCVRVCVHVCDPFLVQVSCNVWLTYS